MTIDEFVAADAVKGLVAASLGSAGQVLDGTGDGAPVGAGYAIFYDTPGRITPDRYGAVHSKWRWIFRFMCVGHTPDQCRWTTRRVRAALSGVRLDPTLAPIAEDGSGPMLVDGPEGDRRFSQTLIYVLPITTRSAP